MFASKQCLASLTVQHSRTVQAECKCKSRITDELLISHSSHINQNTEFLKSIISHDNDFKKRTTLMKFSVNWSCETHDLESDFDFEFKKSVMLLNFEESKMKNTVLLKNQAITSSTSLSSQCNFNIRQYMSQKSNLSWQIMWELNVTSQTYVTLRSVFSATLSEIWFNSSDSADARQHILHMLISTLFTSLFTQSQSFIFKTDAHYHNLLESDYIWCLLTLICHSLLMFLINKCVSDMIKIILKNMNTDDKCF